MATTVYVDQIKTSDRVTTLAAETMYLIDVADKFIYLTGTAAISLSLPASPPIGWRTTIAATEHIGAIAIDAPTECSYLYHGALGNAWPFNVNALNNNYTLMLTYLAPNLWHFINV